MSLRRFHLVFIGVSVMLAAFMAAWAGQQFQAAQGVVYGTKFQRKTKGLIS
jgi:hypothetical protein